MNDPTTHNPPPIPIVLFFNLMLLALITLAFLLASNLAIAQCVSPLPRALSLAVIALTFYHLFWHYFGMQIRRLGESIEFGGVSIPISVIAAISDGLHPRMPGRVWWLSAFILSVLALALLSPFLSIPVVEPAPVIQSFTIHFPDGTAQTRLPGDDVEILSGSQILVEGELLQPTSVHCTWSTTRGRLLPAGGCASYYNAPLIGNIDTLTVQVQSRCKTQEAYSSLRISVAASQ